MSEAFKLGEDGDLDISPNGVIRTIMGDEVTLQSAIMLIGNKKNSYPFVPEIGVSYHMIFNYDVPGATSDEAIAEIVEMLFKAELAKDPNIGTVSNFNFERAPGTRTTQVTFDIAVASSVQTIGVNLG